MSEVKSIEPKDLQRLHEKGENPYVIDVRNPGEYQEVRSSLVQVLMPLDQFDPSQIAEPMERPIYFICRSGRRSFEAASMAAAEGFSQVFNVEGGTLQWESDNLPIERG